MISKPVPLTIRRKSSARLAAVQCIYRLKLNPETITPEALCESYMEQWQDDKESGNKAMSKDAEPDKKLFLALLSAAMEHHAEIEQIIRLNMSKKWTYERVSRLMIAIIRCGIAEMKFLPNPRPSMIINEYINIAGRFFETQEVGFINGMLDNFTKF